MSGLHCLVDSPEAGRGFRVHWANVPFSCFILHLVQASAGNSSALLGYCASNQEQQQHPKVRSYLSYTRHQLAQRHKMVLCHNTQGGKRERSLCCSAQVTGTIHTTLLFIGFDWALQSLLQTKGARQILLWSTQHVRRQKSDGIREKTKRKLFFFKITEQVSSIR